MMRTTLSVTFWFPPTKSMGWQTRRIRDSINKVWNCVIFGGFASGISDPAVMLDQEITYDVCSMSKSVTFHIRFGESWDIDRICNAEKYFRTIKNVTQVRLTPPETRAMIEICGTTHNNPQPATSATC